MNYHPAPHTLDFRSSSNVTLLRDALQRSPVFQRMTDKEVWFREGLDEFCKRQDSSQAASGLSFEELRLFNRAAIQFLLHRLLTVQDQFQQRQSEYERMVKPANPTEINFRMEDDQPLENLHELVEQQRSQREFAQTDSQGPPLLEELQSLRAEVRELRKDVDSLKQRL